MILVSNNVIRNQIMTVKHQNTAEFAERFLVKPQTVLKRFCLTGEYYGIVPLKLPNGRLAWPCDQASIVESQGSTAA